MWKRHRRRLHFHRRRQLFAHSAPAHLTACPHHTGTRTSARPLTVRPSTRIVPRTLTTVVSTSSSAAVCDYPPHPPRHLPNPNLKHPTLEIDVATCLCRDVYTTWTCACSLLPGPLALPLPSSVQPRRAPTDSPLAAGSYSWRVGYLPRVLSPASAYVRAASTT